MNPIPLALSLLLILVCPHLPCCAAVAAEAGLDVQERKDLDDNGIFNELRNGFDWRFKILGFGIVQEPRESPLNANNRLMINRYQTELDLRPDVSLKFRSLDLSVKPRVQGLWKRWEDGFRNSDWDVDGEIFVNEWLARFMVKEDLFVSYGRENLQWGPAFLTSPSNPFNRDNGKENPEREVPGLDYARTVWIPANNLSASLIANVDRGEKHFFREFNRTYAAKFDYTGNKKYLSLIPSYSESGVFRLGFFGGLSVTDALLVYAEGNFYDWDGFQFLVGESYTLEAGPTVSIEYYHNEVGCTDSIEKCFPPFGKSSPDDVLIRKNYLMLQLAETRIRDSFNVILRWIYDMDDSSSRSVAILEYELGQHMKLFGIGDFFWGRKDTELGSLMKYSLFMGAEYSF